MTHSVKLLNDLFLIETYNGGVEAGTGERLKIDNILNTEKNSYHCSSKGTKFSISLKMKDESEFRLSHLSFRAAPRCTSQLKTGIFFVTDT